MGTFGGALRRLLDYEQLIPYLESFSSTKTYFRVLNIRCLSKCQYCFYSSKWIFHFSLLFSSGNFPCDQKSDQPVAATCCWCKTTKQQKQCDGNLSYTTHSFDVSPEMHLNRFRHLFGRMKFVINGTCVKCSWAGVKFSRINAKNYQTRICQIQVGGFTK